MNSALGSGGETSPESVNGKPSWVLERTCVLGQPAVKRENFGERSVEARESHLPLAGDTV